MDFAPPPAPEGRPGQAERLFSASTYSDWVRESMRLRAEHPTTIALFESTIDEPLPALMEVIRYAFSLNVSPRYVSVFAGGNRFAIEALSRRYGVGVDQILTTTGATSALGLALKALVEDDDHVLIESPGFDLLARVARDSRARVETFARRAPDFAVDLNDLARKIGPRTRAIVLTNLHNPSGALTSDADLLKIAALADQVGARVIIDEVYADFARPKLSRSAAGLADNIITVSSLTKVFGLFSLKFGWICASTGDIARIQARSPEGDIGVSKLAHAVAAQVLEESDVFDLHWKRLLTETRPVAERRLRAMIADGLLEGPMPAFGSMAFPKVVGVDDTLALAKALWIRHDLLVAPGEYFGLAGHIRLGFGSEPAALDRALAHLHDALSEMAQRRPA
ncbi:pyridoxal phosphate-dependent aminotransferase [Caulobacter soli]|uniref:pyridoxal phosphate-dependent aminotransferase n=1 Tax=Caulobacter soli TaxID=2708539 RepID=UPI0013EE30A2|nr:pyridoxal phosphate-dependent aminotransferase [Caulobacter soli]